MQSNADKPTIGLALSGSGNRSSYYIGFLEVLEEHGLGPDYIAACSGGCLVAAAYACGTLPEFKQKVLGLTKQTLGTYLVKSESRGGLYSMDLLEEEIRNYTKNYRFEDVRPLMGFVAVDIESGEKVVLSMGDIARAARISCTLPGIFEPIKWGGKVLIDGGLLTLVPGDLLKEASMDVSIGINMRGTKHIFTENFIHGKKIYNFFKRMLFVEEIASFFLGSKELEDIDFSKKPGLFSVIGRSLDLAIAANKQNLDEQEACDLTISPDIPTFKKNDFTPESLLYYYECGRQSAEEYIPKIKQLVEAKQKVKRNS